LPSNVCDAQINWGWVTLGQHLDRKGLTGIARFKRDLGEAWVCRIFAKEILSRYSAFEQNARTSNVTDKQTDNGTGNFDRNRQNRLSTMLPNN